MLARRAHHARSQSEKRENSRFTSRSPSSATARPLPAVDQAAGQGADGRLPGACEMSSDGHAPHCEPAPNPTKITLQRLRRGQAEGDVEYQFTELGDATQYFAAAAEETLQLCTPTALLTPFIREPLTPIQFMYTQLQPSRLADADIEHEDGEYTTFKVGKERYVSNPLGKTFTITNLAKRPFTLRLVCTLGPQEDGEPAVCFSYEKVRGATVTVDFKVNDRVCKVSVGQLFCGSFSEFEWQYVKPLAKFFMERCWPFPVERGGLADEAEEESAERTTIVMQNFQGRLSKKKKGWQDLCNFEVTRIVRKLTVEESEEKYFIVECRQTWSEEELPMMELAHDVKYHQVPNGTKYKEFYSGVVKEVVVPQSISTDQKLNQLLSEAFPDFIAHHLTLKNFGVWLDELKQRDDCGPTQHTISYYGRQKSGWHVMSNCAFQNGTILPHEEAGLCVMTSVFKVGKAALMPVTCHPSVFLVPNDHVRFIFLLQFWNEMLPRHFTNNVIPVKAAICTAIMHLQGDKFWGGQGPAPGLPMAWLHSTEGSTGKSRSQILINAMLGFVKDAALLQGCTTSRAALFMRLGQQSCLSLPVDEFTTRVHRDKEQSTKIKDIAHACFDGSQKSCLETKESSGTVKPLTSCIVSSNVIPNQDDAPFLQRILFLRFMKRVPFAEGWDPSSIQDEFYKTLKVVSCLLPDFEAFLVDGHLDCDGLSDCTTFTNTLLDAEAQRHANVWGCLLYYMLLMWRCTCTSREDFKVEELHETFKFVCAGVGVAHQEAEENASTLDMFLRAFELVRTSLSANPLVAADRCVHHHNYRTTAKPAGYQTLTNKGWIAIHLESACGVIEKVTGERFHAKEIKRAAEERVGCKNERAYFYDVKKCPWPIVTTNVDEATGCVSQVALPEEQLQDATLSRMRCLWIEKTAYERVVSGEEYETRTKRYDTLKITSHGRTFNLFQEVQKDSWYAALHQKPFGMFCGIQNALLVPSKPSELTADHFLEGVDDNPADHFNLDTYLANYNHSWDQVPPPLPLQYNLFAYRNDWDDEYVDNAFETRVPSDEMDEGDDIPADTLEIEGSTPKSRRSPELDGDMTEVKRPRYQFVNEEADINSDDEAEASWHTLLYPTNYSHPIPA